MLKYNVGLLGLALAGVVAVGSASAADIYTGERGSLKDNAVYVPLSWTGFYLGAHVGGASGDLSVKDVDDFIGGGLVPGAVTSSDPSGAFGGGTLGYNWQRGHVVYGVEADIGTLDLSASKVLTGATDDTAVGVTRGLYGDLTARLGYAADRTLIYVKGGAAFYNGDGRFHTDDEHYTSYKGTDTFTGWTAGGGIEYLITPALSVKAEYQYFDFGTATVTASGKDVVTARFDEDLTAHTIKAGLNYHFNRDYEALK